VRFPIPARLKRLSMPTEDQNSPQRRPSRVRQPDVAAEHARSLLRAFDHPLKIADREQPVSAPLEWARSGAMELTGAADGVPQFAAGGLASAACGAGMLLRALAPRSALAGLDAPALLAERAAIAGLHRKGEVSAGGSARLIATRTDHLAINLPRDEDWQLTPAWLEANASDFATRHDWKALTRLISEQDVEGLVDRGRLMGLAIAQARKTVPTDRPPFTIHHASETSPTSRQRPIRLLDLSSLWAGPLATSLLARTGIEVLKIENPTRPDGARRGPEAFFHLLNGNKQGCALDLHQPHDRAIFERLLESADIVVESARPRALAQLGFDAASWVTNRRGRLWASITGYGRSHEWIAFGDDAAVAAGLAWPPGSDRTKPVFCGDAISDPLAGLTLAALLLAQSQSGRGGLVDLSLTDCAAHAASLPNEGLELPVEAGAHGWRVIEDGQNWTIEKPRARSIEGQAPPLTAPSAAPSEAWLTEWTAPC
jgi:hypothetical protein